MLIHQVAHCFTDTTKTLISEYNSERIIEIGLSLQSYHKNKKCLVFIDHSVDSTLWTVVYKQESAAYATVSARQSRHLANKFEVAPIECLPQVDLSRLFKSTPRSTSE